MSYSLQASGPTKAEVLSKAKEQMAAIVAQQPFHEVDQAPVLRAVEDFLQVLEESPTQDVCVRASGSVHKVDDGVVHVNFNIALHFLDREVKA